MNVRLRVFKSGNVHAEHELTQCGGIPTGIWMSIGSYKTQKGAKIALAHLARSLDTYLSYKPTIYSQF